MNISSNCPQLTIRAIYEQLAQIYDSSSVYIKIENLTNTRIFDIIVKVLNSSTSLTIIIDCDDLKLVELKKVAKALHKFEMKQQIIFVSNETLNFGTFSFNHSPVVRSWNDFTTEFRGKLLNGPMKFQGKLIHSKMFLMT